MPSLNGATSPGPGSATDLTILRRQLKLTTTVTGSAASLLVNLEGSIDGSTWAVLVSTTSPTGDAVLSLDREVRYVRANLAQISTAPGGSAPAVTAFVSVAGPY